jgi:CDP-paratose 2-epimerase
VSSIPEIRHFDIPWFIMDNSLSREVWGWQTQTPLNAILEEIALHAEQHPQWLELSGLQ